MISRPLRFATFLAPNMLPLYEFITRYVGDRLGVPTALGVGSCYDGLAGQAEVSFLCGLAYIELVRQGEPIEPIAAPLLHRERYRGRPVYFSDVIVRRDSPLRSFADLRGRSWSYNEPYSHSGYGITCYHLVRLGETNGFFGRVVQAGWHERSIRLVHSGAVDASAVDSQVLAVALRDQPGLAAGLRVIDSLVCCQSSIDGYSFFNFWRAAATVKVQWTRTPFVFRASSQGATLSATAATLSRRQSRHWLFMMLISDSARFSQLPCLGV
jgi:phosphonate transport system substrate-binding protein